MNSRNELQKLLLELEQRVGVSYFDWVKDHWTSRGEPLDFKEHKYLQKIYEDQSLEIAFCKSSQCGLTERMITEALWLADQFKENAIYVFPNSGDVADLVQERIDDPINNDEYLSKVSGRSKKLMGKQADKVGLKRMSKGFVYFRGSNKPTQITSIAADVAFVDEVDRMVQENIPYINKRLKHSNRKWLRWASTPTIPNYGIDVIYQTSDQHECWLTCTHCDYKQVLNFWDNIDKERELLICSKCKEQIIPWLCEMDWIPKNPNASIRGYHVSQLYSPRLDIRELIKDANKTSEWEVMQFYNQDLGLPYEPKGAKITEDDLKACTRDYTIPFKSPTIEGFIGIDVGKILHVVIRDNFRIIFAGEFKDFEELDSLMNTYNVKCGVVDGNPETREALKFAKRFSPRVHLCYYTGMKEVKFDNWFVKSPLKVNTGRTISLDITTNEIKTQNLWMPKNLNDIKDYKAHLKNLIRVIREEKDGNKIAEYMKTGDDHYYHATNYATLAKHVYNKRDLVDILEL